MKKTYLFVLIVIVILILLVSIKIYLKNKEYYTNITDAKHDEISKVVRERFEDSIISTIITDEGKIIECTDGVLFLTLS